MDTLLHAQRGFTDGLQVLHFTLKELACSGADGPGLELMDGLAGFDGTQGVVEDQGAGDDGLHGSGLRRSGLRSNQFRPNIHPVGRAEVLASDGTACCQFNSMAIHRSWPAICIAVLPLAHLSITFGSDLLAQFGNG